MNRIYHRYENWECWKNGFFDNISGEEKKVHQNKVIELFSNYQNTEIFMRKVISEWKYSCEHNLTNISLNRVAWLGQAAMCIYSKTPSTITMEAWWLVDQICRDKADETAKKIIEEYEQNLQQQ